MSETPRELDLSMSHVIEGLQVPILLPAENLRSAINYRPRDDDLFIATFPKCGTTWGQQIIILILRKGQPLNSFFEMMMMSPFIDFLGANVIENMIRPGAIKTHLPFRLVPWSEKAKYIYITRNPKDCCVSYFHHMKDLPGHGFKGNFDDYFEYFISGKTDFGDYFDNLLGWYEKRNSPNVLFLTYESMKENPRDAILKIASFIDEKAYGEPLRTNPEMLENVLKYSSFDHMKESINKGVDAMFSMTPESMANSEIPDIMKAFIARAQENTTNVPQASQFVRKGIVGDWRNYFSEQQSRRLDEKFQERTKNTDIPNYFKKYM